MLGDRFYARVHSFDVSCPACGQLIRVGSRIRGAKGAYTARLARLRCPGCEQTYIIGLVCWPIAKGGHHAHRSTRPADQHPDPRTALQMRTQGGGWWPETALKRHRAAQSNVTGQECTCPEGRGIYSDCPLHGKGGEN